MSIGARIREAREARGLSLDELARITRIAPHWLSSIERDDASVFPPGPYGPGFVRAYAREVGLDPDRTAREYFAQFQPTAPPPPPVRQRVDVEPGGLRSGGMPGFAIVLLLALLAAWALWPDAARERAAEAGAVGTSGATPAAVGPADAPANNTATQPATAGLSVTLEADHPVWVSANADGKRVVYRTMEAGAREELRAERSLTFRVGDAGAVRWSVAGRPAAAMGARGEVRNVTITPDNAHTVR